MVASATAPVCSSRPRGWLPSTILLARRIGNPSLVFSLAGEELLFFPIQIVLRAIIVTIIRFDSLSLNLLSKIILFFVWCLIKGQVTLELQSHERGTQLRTILTEHVLECI